jgi:hypothetical protein
LGPPQEPSAFKGRGRAARCKDATAVYLAWADRERVSTSSRVKAITAQWVEGQWPTISQQHAKAAALRAMLPWVAELAEAQLGHGQAGPASLLQAKCLRGLADLDQVYSCHGSYPRFLSSDQEQAAVGHCAMALQALAELEKLTPHGPWRLIPKAHALLHLACDSAMGNPRVAHCYQDEDFVGRVKRMYTSCHGKTAPRCALERYCLGVSITLTAREELLNGQRSVKARRLSGGPLAAAHTASPAPTASGPSVEPQAAKRGRGRPRKPTVKRPVGRPKRQA